MFYGRDFQAEAEAYNYKSNINIAEFCEKVSKIDYRDMFPEEGGCLLSNETLRIIRSEFSDDETKILMNVILNKFSSPITDRESEWRLTYEKGILKRYENKRSKCVEMIVIGDIKIPYYIPNMECTFTEYSLSDDKKHIEADKTIDDIYGIEIDLPCDIENLSDKCILYKFNDGLISIGLTKKRNNYRVRKFNT